MRKILHDGPYKCEILDRDESILTFTSVTAAVAFFRQFANDAAPMRILRGLVAEFFPGVHPLSTEEVFKECASLLVRGQISILRSAEFLSAGTGADGDAEKAKQAAANAETAAPKKKSWIEITLIDEEGDPVPGERYRIKFPDGSSVESRLDGCGHSEYYDINPGTCEVCFPDLDGGAWSRI